MDATFHQDSDYNGNSMTSEYGQWSFGHYTTPVFDSLNCLNCSAQGRICYGCGFPYPTFEDLSLGQDEQAITPLRNGNRHAARPLQFQEMESSSSGAGALTAAPLSENPHTQHQSGGMTEAYMEDPKVGDGTGLGLSLDGTADGPLFADLPEVSNGVNAGGDNDLTDPDGEAARALNSLATWTTNPPNGEQAAGMDFSSFENANGLLFTNESLDAEAEPALDINGLAHSQEALDSFERDPQNAKAYAKLVFADGDLFITTHDVMLGRNLERFQQMRRRAKQQKKAREELDTYRKEPSQPSQPGDEDQHGDPSNSSQSLEGRPAPPSNFSEHGGPVWYPPHSDGELEIRQAKPRRRVSHFSKSSSTTSVAPANLHLSAISDIPSPYNEPEARTFAFIPIHTSIPEDIGKISREHLMFSFNFQTEQWELKVLGNGAFVNEELFEKGTVVHLQHNDEILLASVHMVFKLPDNFRQSPGLSRGTFSRHSDDEEDVSDEDSELEATAISTSPVRRLSNALDVDSSESEEELEEQEASGKPARKKPKLKIQTKSSKPKSKAEKAAMQKASKKAEGKKGSRKDAPEAESPKLSKKVEKAKKGKTGETETTKVEDTQDASPPAAPYIKPGSALEGIPLEELPEKRKGPGRPPKEGNVSKRDTALANKKRKEYEKMGKEPPAFKDLVAMVRRENKAKETQARLIASGQLEPGADVLPSIENEAGDGVTGRFGGATDGSTNETARRSPPRPKRNVKALSPVKPMEECTDEDLKRPDQTYVHILDEILRNHPGDGADLPDIYARMEKRYPYYKYKCPTNGWQSSVRHNLQQSPRFKEAGKAGKGKLWTIDYDSPLEKEKKRKATPPKQPMHNGQFIPGQMPHSQYGQAHYGNPFGQHLQNGQLGPGHQPYYSPYPQQHGQFAGHGTMHATAYPQRPPPHPAQAQTNGLAPQFKAVVDELLLFNNRHLSAYASNFEEQERQKFLLNAVMEYISAYFHNSEPTVDLREKVVSNAVTSRPIYDQLVPLFRKHQPGLVVPSPFEEDRPTQANNQEAQAGAMSIPTNDSGADAAGLDSAHDSPNGAANSTTAEPNRDESKTAAGSDKVAAQSMTPQQRGTKRDATEADAEPDAKRPKSGEA